MKHKPKERGVGMKPREILEKLTFTSGDFTKGGRITTKGNWNILTTQALSDLRKWIEGKKKEEFRYMNGMSVLGNTGYGEIWKKHMNSYNQALQDLIKDL